MIQLSQSACELLSSNPGRVHVFDWGWWWSWGRPSRHKYYETEKIFDPQDWGIEDFCE